MVPPFGGSNPSAPAIFIHNILKKYTMPKSDIKTLIIKIGSSILSGDDLGINSARISSLVYHIAKLKKTIPNIVIVSSGAVASGFKLLGFKSRPKDIIDKQAAAAVGQARLIWTYEQAFAQYNINVAQVLITKDDLSNRKRYIHARSTLKRLLELNVIPIINENDTIIVDELKYIETFGDNDNLGALVAGLVDGDLLLILSDVEGLYTADPSKDKNAEIIHNVEYIDDDIMNSAGGSVSNVGTGGMKSKLNAAKKALDAGCEVAIIRGMEPENIDRFFKEGDIGTYFSQSSVSIKKFKFWLRYAAIPKGNVIVDDGAITALSNNKSLLSKGIIDAFGKFQAGDVVSVRNTGGKEIARGKIRYPLSDIAKIKGRGSADIYDILGYKISDEIIHKDDLMIISDSSFE